MRRGIALAGWIACASLLVACAGHKSRPASTAGGNARASATSSRDTGDDTSRPQSERYRQNQDDGPDSSPVDIAGLAEPVPKVEPLSRYGNKSTYSVRGRTYHVLPSESGYVERGTASWYGRKFHGFLTSSFEPYDMYAFSAAHKTLPLPSYARVTNLDNGKSVVVRVNDRGPFHDGRIIDLSYAAAVRIGLWPKGTARVEVRAIDPAHPDTGSHASPDAVASVHADSAARPAASGAGTATALPNGTRIYLQLGAFTTRENADRLAARTRRAGIGPVDIKVVELPGRTVLRVRVGPLADAADADALRARIERLGLGTPRVAIER